MKGTCQIYIGKLNLLKYQVINDIFKTADIVRYFLGYAAGSGKDICNTMFDTICGNICGNIGGNALEGYQKV